MNDSYAGENATIQPAPVNTFAMPELSRLQRIKARLFPALHVDLPSAPAHFKDVVCFNAVTEFSIADRLRILVSGRIETRAKIVCENTVGTTISQGVCYPVAP